MIRRDIMEYLSGENLDKIFLPHRDNIDPRFYRVGEVVFNNDINVVVWNPIDNLVMDYYFDDLDEEWLKLSEIFSEEDYDKYSINRKGDVIGMKGKKLSVILDAVWGYPTYKIKGKHVKIHNLLGRMFIPNSRDDRDRIDHINRDKQDYSLSNLRWSTPVENGNNIYRPKWTGRHLYIAYEDFEFTTIVKEYSDEEFYKEIGGSTEKGIVLGSATKNIKAFGYYWKVVNLEVKEYLESFGISEIDKNAWVKHYSGNFYVHPLGLIMNPKSSMEPKLGYVSADKLNSKHKERKFHGQRVHILVAEVFLNNNQPIEKGKVIDHINTNPLDNRAINLRICSQKENMSNELTVKKLSKAVIDPEGKIFSSLTECSKHYGVTPTSILNWIKNPNKDFNYYNED